MIIHYRSHCVLDKPDQVMLNEAVHFFDTSQLLYVLIQSIEYNT